MRDIISRIVTIDKMISDNKEELSEKAYNNFRFHMDLLLSSIAKKVFEYNVCYDDLEYLERYIEEEEEETENQFLEGKWETILKMMTCCCHTIA